MALLERCGWVWPLLLAPALGAAAPARTGPPPDTLLTIHVEQKVGDRAEAMLPGHVFKTGDIVRFRVTGGRDGYLYVLDHGSSGEYNALFPAADSGGGNRMEKGTDYLVPAAGDGWFQIEAPAGFEVVYFLLSPRPLQITADTQAAPAPAPPDTLIPRCNDAIFQARGECIDSSAGPAPLPRDAPLPPQIAVAAPQASRDIVFTSGDDGTSVYASAATDKPVVYTFRLAHR